MNPRTYAYRCNSTQYSPVITVKIEDLLYNYEEYPTVYKENYRKNSSACTSADLGTKDCPYIIKLAENVYSWGN